MGLHREAPSIAASFVMLTISVDITSEVLMCSQYRYTEGCTNAVTRLWLLLKTQRYTDSFIMAGIAF